MEDLPKSFFCALTQEVMRDPVIDPDGFTYERKAIQDWLGRNPTSPMTRGALSAAQLVPNRALREAIEEKGVLPPLPAGEQEYSASAAAKAAASAAPAGLADVEVTAQRDGEDDLVLVSIKPVGAGVRAPVDICCVIDTSGSMSIEASLTNAAGDVEKHGLTILDIVKHAVKTIIHTLNEGDRLCLVSYSSSAVAVLQLTQMDAGGRAAALTALESLFANGQTNLWDGLHTGLEMLRKGFGERHASVLLLTDGCPNIVPPRGHLPMLKRYQEEYHLQCQISTFGFGYKLDSPLLSDLALAGEGSYAFIPDSSFVGTTFVHAISNLLATAARRVQLNLEPLNGATFLDDGAGFGRHPGGPSSLQLGSLQHGQSKDVVFRMRLPAHDQPILRVTLSLTPLDGQGLVTTVHEAGRGNPRDDIVQAHLLRLKATETIHTALQASQGRDAASMAASQKLIRDLIAVGEACAGRQLEGCRDLLLDLKGQVTEAFSRADWLSRWGQHYLLSLARAHQLQQCNNFKDPGVQHYGGPLFQQLRDEADAIFCRLPPPVSLRPAPRTGAASSAAAAAPPCDMSQYNNRDNPCFHGAGLVLVKGGRRVRIDALGKNDIVLTPSGEHARVECVVRTRCPRGVADLVRLPAPSNLLVTAWHPVVSPATGEWVFPASLAPVSEVACDAVYSLLLDPAASEGAIVIDGTPAVTLAHGAQGDVREHEFWGTERVRSALKGLPGFDDGCVELGPGCCVRDGATGLVCGLRLGDGRGGA